MRGTLRRARHTRPAAPVVSDGGALADRQTGLQFVGEMGDGRMPADLLNGMQVGFADHLSGIAAARSRNVDSGVAAKRRADDLPGLGETRGRPIPPRGRVLFFEFRTVQFAYPLRDTVAGAYGAAVA